MKADVELKDGNLAYYLYTNEIILMTGVTDDNIIPILVHEIIHWASEMFLSSEEIELTNQYYVKNEKPDMREEDSYKTFIVERITYDNQRMVESNV
jgi:hypothetical protein